MSWKQTVLEAFEVFGPASLFLLSFTEAIIQPIPPDLLYIPMLANAMGDTPLVIWLWLVVTVASVLGSLVGYFIGQRWGTSLMVRFGQEKHLVKLEQLTLRYGSMGIFIAAFSPIPYKVLGWMAGMGHMAKKPFILAGLLGRSLRFGLEAVLIGLYGDAAFDAMMWFLDNEILLGVALILAGLASWLLWRWWNGLEGQPPASETETTA
jgi:undecaprenyl-diphosphatase